jgi:hypothetical protein
MAIPTEPLVLNIDPDSMTLDDVELFYEPTKFKPSAFKAWMGEHSNWTAEQTGKLTLGELKAVAQQIGEAIQEATVPKAKAPA